MIPRFHLLRNGRMVHFDCPGLMIKDLKMKKSLASMPSSVL